jgi:malate:Na+ symporter
MVGSVRAEQVLKEVRWSGIRTNACFPVGRAGGHAQLCRQEIPAFDRRRPLQPGDDDELQCEEDADGRVDVATVGAAVVTAVTLYLIGALGQREFGFPAPVAMLVIAAGTKLTRAVSPSLQIGAFHVYKFFSTAVTYPLLFAIGIALTPRDKLVAAFTLPYVITIVSTAMTIMATAFFVGGWMKMYPIDTAIVTACHSGQGRTGDVATLTAANRMQLMPFAQIATRIGGAITVTVVLIALTQIG